MWPIPCCDPQRPLEDTPLHQGGRFGVTIFIAPGAEAVKQHGREMASVYPWRTDLPRFNVASATSPTIVRRSKAPIDVDYRT